MTEREFSIKGIGPGVLITLPTVRWSKQRDILVRHLQTQERFFKGGKVAIDVGETEWQLEDLRGLIRDVGDEGVGLWAVIGTSQITRQSAESLQLATTIKPMVQVEPKPVAAQREEGTLWLEAFPEDVTKLEWEGNLVLAGDLPQEKEICIGGSVIVWGKAMGTIRFGVKKPDESQLRLLICTTPTVYLGESPVEIPKKLRCGRAVHIYRRQGKIEVESDLKGGFRLP